MKKGRKVVTLADLRPFLEKTGQMHLLEGIENPPRRPVATFSPPEGGNTADLAPEVRNPGKKRLQMNGTEREFSLILENWRAAGKIMLWEYEAITLRHGVMSAIAYTPDFVIFDLIEVSDLSPGVPRISMRFIECKGPFIREKDLLRFKAASNYFTMFRFELWQRTKQHGWQQIK